jgi:hypothetical protein
MLIHNAAEVYSPEHFGLLRDLTTPLKNDELIL